MNVLKTIIGGIKKMLGIQDIEKVINVKPVVSQDMVNAIQLWSDMYEGKAPWLKNPTPGHPERVVSLGLPALIASEKARMATIEMESEITPPMVDVEKENPNYQPPSIDEFGQVNMGRESMLITEQTPTGPTERAEFLNEQYKKLKKQIRRQLEYGIAKGGLVIKPYIVSYSDTPISPVNTSISKSAPESEGDKEAKKLGIKRDEIKADVKSQEEDADATVTGATEGAMSSSNPLPEYEIEYDFVQADRFFPLAFDNNGKITEAAFTQTKVDKDKVYTRIEHHVLHGRSVTVSNYAFVRENNELVKRGYIHSTSELGKPCDLTEVAEWANLAPTVTIDDVDRPLFAYFKMPEANTIDTYSPLGVSGYSRVVSLIRDADEQYSRMLWEFEGGELAIDVDRNALMMEQYANGQNQTRMPIKQERLFRKVDLNSEETYNVFAPTLRDDSLVHGLNVILMRIEDACGLSRGTISEQVSADARTATEMKILKQRSYATNADIQEALEDALRDAVYVSDVYCSLYDITPPGEYEISFEWDDSILVDSESELEKRMSMLNAGLTSKVEVRMWYFGETENQAKAALQKIEDEKKMSMETNIMAQAELGEVGQGKDFSGDNNNPNDEKSDDKNNTAASKNS